MRITSVIFDLDGTLLDSEWLGSEAYNSGICSVIGRELSASEKEFLLGKPFQAISVLFPNHDLDTIVMKVLEHYKLHNHKIKTYEGIPGLLNRLCHDGYKLGIVTAKERENAEKELSGTGIRHYFDVVLTMEDTKEFKPSPVPLLQAAELLSVLPEECMYIGDQPTDIEATHAAKMVSVAALWGEGKQERLVPLSPAHCANFPTEVLDFLHEYNIRAKDTRAEPRE